MDKSMNGGICQTIMTESAEELTHRDNVSPLHQFCKFRLHNCTMIRIMVFLCIFGIPLVMVRWQGLPGANSWEDGAVAISEISSQFSDMVQSTAVPTTLDHSIRPTPTAPADRQPQMVWLMSFPNSGTSYTLHMVAAESNRAIATNYGEEFTNGSSPNIPLYPSTNGQVIQGPFWKGQEEAKDLPQKYILTKTHCGGRCVRCGPQKYLVPQSRFLHECTEGRGCFAADTTDTKNKTHTTCEWKFYHYLPPSENPRIAKLIHLIRNPFDNILARFHLARKQQRARLKHNPEELEKWLQQHPDSPEGFATWCNGLDSTYGSPLNHIKPALPSTEHLFCKGEWFKYIQWHTLALGVQTQVADQIPSLIIYYEDYDRDWNQTTKKILDFLELQRDKTSQSHKFVRRASSDSFFTSEHRREAKALAEKLTSAPVWELLKRYF